MSDHVDSGQPLQMLNVNGRSLELDEHGLARLLLDERIKDHPVVVIAVAGAFRKGKSFLLCFLLRYLRNIGRADWLGDPNAPLEGFKWQAGSQCQTTGILLWNEVFLVENSRGEKLAVVLMDTQGTFDCKSATVVHSSIFALSALISSVLVYNVSQNIQENDLQHLQAFIEYGILAQSDQQQQYRNMPDEVGCARPFQSLLFLVRDWQCAYEMPYGLEGGQQLLDSRFDDIEDEELRQLRQKLKTCFMKIRCFLMPHPGLKVAEERLCEGRLMDISGKFKLHLPDLVQLLLEPDNLLPKQINGRTITCQELMSYIKVYVSATKKGLLRDPSAMLEVTHAASCRAALDKALDFYTTSMLTMWQCSPGDVDRETMRGYHDMLREMAIEKYSATPKMGEEEQAQVYLEKLLEKMDATLNIYCEYLKEKKNRSFNTEFFKHVAFKAVHGFVTTGLAAAAIALAVVDLPIVAIALGTTGAVSLTAHFIQVVVEKQLAKRKKADRKKDSMRTAEAAKSRETYAFDSDDGDEEARLLYNENGSDSELSVELTECSATSLVPNVTATSGKSMAQPQNALTTQRDSKRRHTYTADRVSSDDTTPLLNGTEDPGSHQCIDLLDMETVPLDPPFMLCDEAAATETVNSEAYAHAVKQYVQGMEMVCNESTPGLSEEQLEPHHNELQRSARHIFARGCSAAGKRVLRHFVNKLEHETEEQFKNIVNQNREKLSWTSSR
ncbi:atlastin-3-like isoform X2 [Rhipicephalus microplus]|uniref:atlastin-3-like isoform X2 n=1 Tax=Rhipicephalus microplus TaxID=6941 RepID=UPI003F6A9415